MTKQRAKGYAQAKRQHEAGMPIALLYTGFRAMPISEFKVGALEYVNEQLEGGGR
ncbi:hypothetical protein ACQCLI_18380 [Pseudomonas nitroreducens]|uniref:hypothetical protein n=1 Tax=Pseudomonas nitroreducens TaxID=46680 RepID=UPI00031BFDBC|nr:hypothetical protein [Pseudomonas nitroreducens]